MDADLPYLDTHAVAVEAPADVVWPVLLTELARVFSPPLAALYAGAVGCRPATAGGPRPLVVGSTVPGFAVTAVDAPSAITLAGSHRFANYRLRFHISAVGPDRSRLDADSYAEFTGPLGGAYRTAVVGTPLHGVLLRWLLRTVASRARKHSGAPAGEHG